MTNKEMIEYWEKKTMKKIIDDIKKSILYQHKSLIGALDMCKMSPEDKKFVLLLNKTNTRTNLTNLQRLESRFIFKKRN